MKYARLNDDSEFFEAAYGITAKGNWEGKTVLQRAIDDTTLAARFQLDPETVPAKLADLTPNCMPPALNASAPARMIKS
jgi:uncharacterized protein YyaL (SSP411 family)